MGRPHSPQLLEQVASLTQLQTRATRAEHTPIQNPLVRNLGRLDVRDRCATTMPCQTAARHVAHTTQQQLWVHVCRAQRQTNVSLFALIAHRRQIAFNWVLRVATTLRAVGSMVIANLLHLSWSWCDVLSSFFSFCVGETLLPSLK